MAFVAMNAKPRHVPARVSCPVPRHVPPRIMHPVPVPSMAPELIQEQEKDKDSNMIGQWTRLLMQQCEDKTLDKTMTVTMTMTKSESPNDEMWYDGYDVQSGPQQYQYEDENEGRHAYKNDEMWHDWYDNKGDPQQYQHEDENEGRHAYKNDEMWHDWYDNKGDHQQYQHEDENEGRHACKNDEMWHDWYDNKGDPQQPQQASSHEVSNGDSEYESVEEEDFDKEEVIRMTKQVLHKHGCSPKAPKGTSGRRSCGKRGGTSAQACRSRTRRAKKRQRHAMCSSSSSSIPDGKRECCQVTVSSLRFSQLSYLETFQCGRAVIELVRDLWHGKVRVCAPFLRLTVFERPDEKTGQPVLRCIDNRRLWALKEYAELLGEEDLLVHVNLYNMRTCNDFQRLVQNSDATDGLGIRLRKNKSHKSIKNCLI